MTRPEIRVDNYHPKHLSQIELKAVHVGDRPSGQSPEIKTRAVTLVEGETVLAIFGGAYVSLGVLQLWAFISPEASRCPLKFHRKALALLKFLDETEAPRRIQLDVRLSYEDGARWAEALGFKREGIMRGYAPDGEDCWLYSRMRR